MIPRGIGRRAAPLAIAVIVVVGGAILRGLGRVAGRGAEDVRRKLRDGTPHTPAHNMTQTSVERSTPLTQVLSEVLATKHFSGRRARGVSGVRGVRVLTGSFRKPLAYLEESVANYGAISRLEFRLGRIHWVSHLIASPAGADRVLKSNQENYRKAFTYAPLERWGALHLRLTTTQDAMVDRPTVDSKRASPPSPRSPRRGPPAPPLKPSALAEPSFAPRRRSARAPRWPPRSSLREA